MPSRSAPSWRGGSTAQDSGPALTPAVTRLSIRASSIAAAPVCPTRVSSPALSQSVPVGEVTGTPRNSRRPVSTTKL